MSTKPERIIWTELEMSELARAFVEARIKNFLGTQRDVWREAFKVLPEHRRRVKFERNPHWGLLPTAMRAKIKTLWQEHTAKAAETTPAEPAELPPPILLRVEVPQPIDVGAVLKKIDTSILVAQIVTRWLEGQTRNTELLSDIVKRLGAVATVPADPKATPAASPLPVPAKRPKRVAIIGPLDSQMAEIKKAIEEQHLFVEARFIDKEQHNQSIPPSCEFAIVTRHTRHSWFDHAQKEVGNSNVFFVDGPITSVIQKLRDIASRQ